MLVKAAAINRRHPPQAAKMGSKGCRFRIKHMDASQPRCSAASSFTARTVANAASTSS